MEWMNRGARPSAPAPGQPVATGAPAQHQGQLKGSGSGFSPMKLATVVMLFSGAILLIAIAGFFALGGNKPPVQDKYVDSKNMQAVFLNGGQVYFGNIKTINDQFLRMSNIYYLRVNQTVQPNGSSSSNQDISLVKLGCELHGPQDQMVINQNQVIFWENLKGDGQVAKAVADYVKQNPNGQQCNTNANSSSTNNSTSTTPSTSTTTKKN
jgi:hypothetical protein